MVDEPRNDDLDDVSMYDSNSSMSTEPKSLMDDASDDYNVFDFKSKGLHICNLNVRHILPKIDEMRMILSNTNIPDIFGICETFLGTQHPDSLISIDGFSFFRKDRTDTQKKSGGGLILYFRQSLNIKRRADLENSNIETLWAEVNLPKSKPFLVCTVYRPPSACSERIDLFEKEVSVAQTTGSEIILMGDFNIDIEPCSNNKWLSLIQLFDSPSLLRNLLA